MRPSTVPSTRALPNRRVEVSRAHLGRDTAVSPLMWGESRWRARCSVVGEAVSLDEVHPLAVRDEAVVLHSADDDAGSDSDCCCEFLDLSGGFDIPELDRELWWNECPPGEVVGLVF